MPAAPSQDPGDRRPRRRFGGPLFWARALGLVAVTAAFALSAPTGLPVAPDADVELGTGGEEHPARTSPAAPSPGATRSTHTPQRRSRPPHFTLGDAVDAAELSARPALGLDLAGRLEAVRRRPPFPPGLPVGSPVSSGVVSSPFGVRRHPVSGRRGLHTGTDFAVPSGTPVLATADGRVTWSAQRSGYGLAVEVDHLDPSGLATSTLYAHLSASLVRPGLSVRRGQTLGLSGGGGPDDGVSTGPHLHYELRLRSGPSDPTVVYDRVRAWRAETVRRLRSLVADAHERDAEPPSTATPATPTPTR